MGLHDFRVLVRSIEGEEDAHAHVIRGIVILPQGKYPFRAIAFGRIGGHNMHAHFTRYALRRLKASGFQKEQIEEMQLILQRKLVEGDLAIHPRAEPHSHRF